MMNQNNTAANDDLDSNNTLATQSADRHPIGCKCEACIEFENRPTLVMLSAPVAESDLTNFFTHEELWGDFEGTDDEGFRSVLGDNDSNAHHMDCNCSDCFERNQRNEEVDSACDGYDAIMAQDNPEMILRDLLALRENIAHGEHMENIRDAINEGIEETRRRVEVLRAEETPESLLLLPVYVDSGNEEWLDSLFVNEEDPDKESTRYKYAVVDSTVDEPRFSSEAAEKVINSASSGNLMEELKKLVWICKAYRLTFKQLTRIKQAIRAIRVEIRRQEELDIILREKEWERMENAHFEALYASQEETTHAEIRRRIDIKTNKATESRQQTGKLKRRASKGRSEHISKPWKMERRRERMLASEAM